MDRTQFIGWTFIIRNWWLIVRAYWYRIQSWRYRRAVEARIRALGTKS